MASNINTTDINADYPVAGQDNDSQGFRDNFSTIKSNFVATKTEIEALQTQTAKISDGDGQSVTNNFLGGTIKNANFQENTEVHFPGGTVINQVEVSTTNGPYQSYTVNADGITFALTDWPDEVNKVSKITVMLLSTGDSFSVNFSSPGGSIVKSSNWPAGDGSITVDSATDRVVVEFMTFDGGSTILAEYKGVYS